MGVKTSTMTIQSPEEAKLINLRDCFREIGNLKFAALLLVITCILASHSCNLSLAADYAPHTGCKAERKAVYARLVRFFSTGIGEELHKGVMRAVLLLALQSGSPCCLTMDRTDWKFGVKWNNLLVVGLSFRGYLVPLVWADLGSRGNSDAWTRLMLLDRLAQLWPTDKAPLKSFPLVADREFGGEDWLVKLAKRGFSFVVRIKSNRQLSVWTDGKIRDRPAKLRAIRRCLARKGLKSAEVVIAGEHLCHVACLPNTGTRDKEPYIYLLTNLDDVEQAGDYYQVRWTIECCFKHLKTNGFDLEAQGFKHEHQLEIVMAVLTLLYVLCVLSGSLKQDAEALAKGKPALKKYRDGKSYRVRSLFKSGFEWLIKMGAAAAHRLLHLFNELFYCLSSFYGFD